VLLHPAGQGTRRLLRDPAHLDWVRHQRAEVPLMTSVCTGSLVYAAAGLLRGRPATTYWGALDELRALDPSVQAREHERWVDDGDIITSAGVSAGIDMALHPRRTACRHRAGTPGQTRHPIRPAASGLTSEGGRERPSLPRDCC